MIEHEKRSCITAGGFTLVEIMVVVAIIMILVSIVTYNYSGATIKAKIAKAQQDLHSIAGGVETYFIEYNSYPFTYPIQGYDEDRYMQEKIKDSDAEESLGMMNKPILNSFYPPSFNSKKPHWAEGQYDGMLHDYKVPEERLVSDWTLRALVDPMEYFQEIPHDPFTTRGRYTYEYHTNKTFGIVYFRYFTPRQYFILSVGPGHGSSNMDFFTIYGLSDDDKDTLRNLIKSQRLHLMANLLLEHYDVTNGLISNGDIIKYGP